ncbi:hypothetical protein NESM_000103000 [Novymonas esmeraldas]|uniref:Uncharacterized protein n=1 Tax=Novymonas esmeraldas TaxID=1808958 RepID=A0AAW0F3V2_9TRYP
MPRKVLRTAAEPVFGDHETPLADTVQALSSSPAVLDTTTAGSTSAPGEFVGRRRPGRPRAHLPKLHSAPLRAARVAPHAPGAGSNDGAAVPLIAGRAPGRRTERGRRAATLSHVPAAVAAVADVPELLRSAPQPSLPSMAACLAVCFGWRLVHYGVDEQEGVMFTLQHRTATGVRVSVVAACSSLTLALSGADGAHAAPVSVDGSAMTLVQCAAHLRQLSGTVLTTLGTTAPHPDPEDVAAVASPTARAPAPLSLTAEGNAAEHRAKKRARSASPSPYTQSSPSPPPSPEHLSALPVVLTIGGPAPVVHDAAASLTVHAEGSPSPLHSSSLAATATAAEASLKTECTSFSQPPPPPPLPPREAAVVVQGGADTPRLSALAARGSSTERREASTVEDGRGALPDVPQSSTVFASPTMRQRRTVVPASAPHAAPPTVVSAPHSPRPTTATPLLAAGRSPAAPSPTGVPPGALSGAPVVWSDAGGWSTESSHLWLAHTHAVSHAFAHLPLPRRCAPSAAVQLVSSAAPPQSDSAAVAAAAVVRAALSRRWRECFSLSSAMEDSLRMAVASAHLRGDALEAGVQALQASEEERRQYGEVHPCVDTSQSCDGVLSEEPAPSFPARPPRALLPVSGRAVVEAQHRTASVDEARGMLESAPVQPRYTVCVGGIPYADRIAIDHTYTTRGSYTVSPLAAVGGGDDAASAARLRLPAVQRNVQEDLHHHVYKRVMPTEMRVAVEAEEKLALGLDGAAAAHAGAVAPLPPSHSRRDRSVGEEEDEEEEEEEEPDDGVGDGDATEKRARGAPGVPHRVVRAGAGAGDAARDGGTATDVDYVLRHRLSIQRIPMPDVESRYGP